jgi:tripartite-type tricarboxylate transporter receptor subunit TctC
MSPRRHFMALSAALFASTSFLPAFAQEWPPKTVTLVVGFAAGGATDGAARIIAKKLQENIGRTVVVENRAGAGGNLAHQYVSKATPDGSVILLGSIGPLAIAPHLMNVGYDPQKDLAPLTMGVTFPNVLVVNPTVGVKTLAEFVAKAKAKPGSIDYASTGNGSASHLAGELLNQRAGIDTVHIPYKGGAPALQDLLGGRVAAYYSTPLTAAPHIEAGKLIPLATTGLARSPFMPNVPTIAESGYPGFNATNWYAFVAPGKTPAAVLDRWNAELVKALNAPEVKAELDKHGLTPAPGSREELARTIASESKAWGQLIKGRGIKAD